MVVRLPSSPRPRECTPRFLDWGGTHVSPVGGSTQHVSRVGSRSSFDVSLPVMKMEPLGRIWVNRLKMAKDQKRCLFEIFQVGFNVGAPGAPVVDGATAIANSSIIPARGFEPGYHIREGQWFSAVDAAGRRYLHTVDEDILVGVDGLAQLPVTPMLRASFLDGATLEFDVPLLDGSISGDELSWTIDVAKTVGLQFTVTEDR